MMPATNAPKSGTMLRSRQAPLIAITTTSWNATWLRRLMTLYLERSASSVEARPDCEAQAEEPDRREGVVGVVRAVDPGSQPSWPARPNCAVPVPETMPIATASTT